MEGVNAIKPFSDEDIQAARLAENLALACGTDPTEAKDISKAVALHDVGKLKIPESILMKPDELTPDEFAIMKTHTCAGAEMLSCLRGAFGKMAQTISLFHHEKYDKTGYWGLPMGELPLYVQIAGICDVYVALISERAYKHAWTHDEALKYIYSQSGEQFDPKMVDTFITLMDKQTRHVGIFTDVTNKHS